MRKLILIACVAMAVAGCGGGKSESGNQDVLDNQTPVWQCIQNGGTWQGSTIDGHCGD